MAQVTIYVEDSALQAAREAAARAQMSLSQWFAQFAAEEKRRRTPNWDAFFAELDALQAFASLAAATGCQTTANNRTNGSSLTHFIFVCI